MSYDSAVAHIIKKNAEKMVMLQLLAPALL